MRRGGPVGPDGVDGVRADRHEVAARLLRRLAQARRLAGSRQPGVEAQLLARAQMRSDPGLGRLLRDGDRRDHRRVDLIADRQRVAPVDENGGLRLENDSEAGGAGEAGQPGEALLARRHIFVLVAIRARHDETVEALPRQFAAQRLDPYGAVRAVVDVVEGLEMALEHGRSPMPVRRPRTPDAPAACRSTSAARGPASALRGTRPRAAGPLRRRRSGGHARPARRSARNGSPAG